MNTRESPRNTIICQDCLVGLSTLPDNYVDFCFTDPPYNTGKDYGAYKDDITKEEYTKFMSNAILHMKRVSKKGICLFLGHKNLKLIWNIVPEADLVVVHRRAIGGYDSKYFHMYRPLLTTAHPTERNYDLWNDVRLTSEGYYFREERFPHPAYTSRALTTKVIKTYTKRGDFVLDPFMGVGTTAVISKKYGRDYLGYELNPEYIKIANKRLERTKNAGKMLKLEAFMK